MKDEAAEESEIADSGSVSGNNANNDSNRDDGNESGDENSNSSISLQNKTPREIANMSREQLEESIPDGWDFQNHNGRIHIRDSNGNFRIRIDPPDKVTNYTHIHVYDEWGNSLDEFGNIVSPKSPLGHLPYNY